MSLNSSLDIDHYLIFESVTYIFKGYLLTGS